MVYSGIVHQIKDLWIGRDSKGFIICRDGKEYAEVLDRAENIVEAMDKLLAIHTGIKTTEDILNKLMGKNHD